MNFKEREKINSHPLLDLTKSFSNESYGPVRLLKISFYMYWLLCLQSKDTTVFNIPRLTLMKLKGFIRPIFVSVLLNC